MSEALEWLKDSFSDAVEDFENDDGCEGIPLVPIMDYAVNAMENADFIETLKALGIAEPFDEQVRAALYRKLAIDFLYFFLL